MHLHYSNCAIIIPPPPLLSHVRQAFVCARDIRSLGCGIECRRSRPGSGPLPLRGRSYSDRDTERLAAGDLAALNSNRLEGLEGIRKGQFSIRINDRWRICFEWAKAEPGPSNVEIVDYH